jgi:hypothetical protein
VFIPLFLSKSVKVFIFICFVSFALCYVLITSFMFLLFVLCLYFILYVLFSILCVLCIVSPSVHRSLFVYKCTDHCHWVKTQLQLINISYRIIPNHQCLGLQVVSFLRVFLPKLRCISVVSHAFYVMWNKRILLGEAVMLLPIRL